LITILVIRLFAEGLYISRKARGRVISAAFLGEWICVWWSAIITSKRKLLLSGLTHWRKGGKILCFCLVGFCRQWYIQENSWCRNKCEELLCHIFAILVQRLGVPASSMHIHDVKAIYLVKSRLQTALNEPPNISLLAKEAGMSEPKLRKLFKQTFGKGVFGFYQAVRMQEAARLLKEQQLTVSEVGYQLGFTNLSHFSRVFEQHIGLKPKKYSNKS